MSNHVGYGYDMLITKKGKEKTHYKIIALPRKTFPTQNFLQEKQLEKKPRLRDVRLPS